MFTSLRLVNFKNFADETLKLGPFTVIVGANASGKSNIRDAFRFLHGIGRGYTLAEIIGGKVGDGGQTVWEPLRGAPIEITRFEKAYPFSWSKFSFGVDFDSQFGMRSYSIEVGFNQNDSDRFRIFREELRADTEVVYEAKLDDGSPRLRASFLDGYDGPADLRSNQTALQQIFEWGFHIQRPRSLLPVYSHLGAARFIELSTDRLREPSVGGTTTLGDFGQNLPTALESICSDPERKQTLTSWLQELTPMDVQGFEFPRDPSGRVHLRIVERNGRQISAYSASDGTLKFLAMLALLLNENPSGTYFFEDIDAGIHPNRLWLLLELIERQTAKGNIQVITTTPLSCIIGLDE